MKLEHMTTFGRLLQLKANTSQLVLSLIIHASNKMDLSKQQAPDADPKAIQQINFVENRERAGNSAIFFILVEFKETVLDFSLETLKYRKRVLQLYLVLI